MELYWNGFRFGLHATLVVVGMWCGYALTFQAMNSCKK